MLIVVFGKYKKRGKGGNILRMQNPPSGVKPPQWQPAQWDASFEFIKTPRMGEGRFIVVSLVVIMIYTTIQFADA